MHRFIERLFPLCRSITGEGLRETLRRIREQIPLQITEVVSGSQVLDWTVPMEWNVRDAYVADAQGNRVIDFRKSNLHLVSYSVPVRARMRLAELRPNLHTLPEHPDLIPYRTSYYQENWGFCLSKRQLDAMPDGEYEVVIDSTLAPGGLSFGELVLPGASEDEILISAHVCHPSLADDNLSGIAVATWLARHLAMRRFRRHTFRFLFAPSTIGAIAWLSRNRDDAARIKHGLTLTSLGDDLPFTYKKTIGGEAEIDQVAEHVVKEAGKTNQVIDFLPYGYDERQFNSPGFRLPVGGLMRGRPGVLPEYHTSGDNLSLVKANRLAESWALLLGIIDGLEGNLRYRNMAPYGEPQLGRRGLYRDLGGMTLAQAELAMLWVLNLSDGTNSLLDIAKRAAMPFSTIRAAADQLDRHGLLHPVD